MLNQEKVASLSKNIQSEIKSLVELQTEFEKIITQENDLTPGQYLYLADARARIEAASVMLRDILPTKSIYLHPHIYDPEFFPKFF